MQFLDALRATAKAVDAELDSILPNVGEGPEGQLGEAMRYATLGGGKRLRPFLVIAGADIFGVAKRYAVRVAAAVELVHCYSLVHDDLPCMDDDVLRRGRPTVHVEYDEATAVLVGDALLSLAFEVLSDEATTPQASARVALVSGLARASGALGMVGGQKIDLWAENERLDESQIIRLQRLKTGAMIAFAGEAGAILARAEPTARRSLRMYAHDLGLAFQIADDILDVTGATEEIGKTAGKDVARGKATFVTLLGLEAAGERARLLSTQAIEHLEIFGERADALRALADFVVTRRS